jgi:hypothetical protein
MVAHSGCGGPARNVLDATAVWILVVCAYGRNARNGARARPVRSSWIALGRSGRFRTTENHGVGGATPSLATRWIGIVRLGAIAYCHCPRRGREDHGRFEASHATVSRPIAPAAAGHGPTEAAYWQQYTPECGLRFGSALGPHVDVLPRADSTSGPEASPAHWIRTVSDVGSLTRRASCWKCDRHDCPCLRLRRSHPVVLHP